MLSYRKQATQTEHHSIKKRKKPLRILRDCGKGEALGSSKPKHPQTSHNPPPKAHHPHIPSDTHPQCPLPKSHDTTPWCFLSSIVTPHSRPPCLSSPHPVTAQKHSHPAPPPVNAPKAPQAASTAKSSQRHLHHRAAATPNQRLTNAP